MQISRDTIKPYEDPENYFWHYSFSAYDGGKLPLKEFGKEIQSNKFVIDRGCVLVSRLNPDRPRVWTPFSQHGALPVCSTEFAVLRAKVSNYSAFVYGIVTTSRFWEFMHGRATGTTGSRQRVRHEVVLQFPFPMPPTEVVEKFCEVVKPLNSLVENNQLEFGTLTQIRDALVPKLLSGKIRVKNAEKLVEVV
jgi:type I restriction enzyme S subunit